ncbi:unnamed protein product [Calypogeia fissa]
MGQCLSFAGSFALRPGRRKGQFQTVPKSSTEGKSVTPATSRSTAGLSVLSARRTTARCSSHQRPSNATDEYEAEAASGFFSLSDFSKASGICASPADGARKSTGKEHKNTFGKLIAQEAISDAMRKVSTDRQPLKSRDSRGDSLEKPSPSPEPPLSKGSADHGGRRKNSSPLGRNSLVNSAEIKVAATVADSLNIKGRRSLERLRLLPPENPKSTLPGPLRRSRSRTESFGRSSGRSHTSRAESLKPSLPGPIDFEFLVQKAAIDNPETTSSHSQARKDGELPVPTDLKDPDSAPGSARTSSQSGKDMDDFSKTYRESAAKAAARDRESFKYISSSETDLSITSSVGASPSVRPRRKRQNKTTSSYVSTPDGVVKERRGADSKPKSATSPLPRPVGLTRNKSSPSNPRGTLPVENKPIVRIWSSPGSLHRAGTTAAEAQAQARQKFGHAQLVSRAGKVSSSTRGGSTQSRRRAGSTIPDP